MADAASTAAWNLESQLQTAPTSSAKNDPALKELGQQIQSALDEKVTPPEPVAMPKLPSNPVVDSKQWQDLGLGLVAMAMIAGSHRGNWLSAGQFLNGAMQGYAEGNQEMAQRAYQQFQDQMKLAQAESKERNDQYRQLLNDRSKSIAQLISQYRVMATEDGRQDMQAAAQTHSLEAMIAALMSHETAEERLGFMAQKAQQSLEPQGNVQGLGENLAWQYFYTGKTPSFGMGQSAIRTAFLNGLEDIRKSMNLSPQEFAESIGTQHAQTHALNALTQRASTIDAAEITAMKNMSVAFDLAKKMNLSDIPLLNKAVLEGDVQTGSANAVAYKTALWTAAREYAKVSSGSTGAAGLTDSQIKEAAQIFNAASSPDQIASVMNLMQVDMNNVRSSYKEQIQSLNQLATPTQPSGTSSMNTSAPIVGKTIDFSQLQGGG
jgi:hypothetical protein